MIHISVGRLVAINVVMLGALLVEGGFGQERRYPRALSLSMVFAVLLAGACGLFGSLSAIPLDRVLPLKIKVGEKAPDFALPSADGKTIRLSDFAGHNVLIDFYRGYW